MIPVFDKSIVTFQAILHSVCTQSKETLKWWPYFKNKQTNKTTAKPTTKHQCKWDSQHWGPRFSYLRTPVRYRDTTCKDNDIWPHRTDQEVDRLDGIIYFLFFLFILHLSRGPVTEKKLLFSLQYCKLLYLSLMWFQSIILSVDLNAWKISLTYNTTRQP